MARVVIRTKDGRELIFHRPPYTAAEAQAFYRARAAAMKRLTGSRPKEWPMAGPYPHVGPASISAVDFNLIFFGMMSIKVQGQFASISTAPTDPATRPQRNRSDART